MSVESIACRPATFQGRPACSEWLPSEYDILQTLAIRLRTIEVSQATSVWSPECPESMRRFVQRLSEAGLLDCYSINAHPLLRSKRPLCIWTPGASTPNSIEVSNAAKSRWTKSSIPTEIIVATKKTANLFGADSHGLSKVEERDHDLLLADAFVAHRTQQRSPERQWIGEDFLPKAGYQIKDPDAFLIDDVGQPICVIESAGRYSRKQVESFHEYCDSQSLPYELW